MGLRVDGRQQPAGHDHTHLEPSAVHLVQVARQQGPLLPRRVPLNAIHGLLPGCFVDGARRLRQIDVLRTGG